MIELRTYQEDGSQWLQDIRHGILADEPGLGKTPQAIQASYGKTLIVCPAYVKQHWKRHINEMCYTEPAIIEGTKQQRIDKLLESKKDQYIIINYEMLCSTKEGRPKYPEIVYGDWDTIIFDEAHRLQSRKSQMSKNAFMMRQTKNIFMLTGTPIWNKPDSIWNLLHILDPMYFTSYWKFVDSYCQTIETTWGKQIVGAKNTLELSKLLDRYMLRREKANVLEQLPPKIIVPIEYTLCKKQIEKSKEIKKKMLLLSENGDVQKAYTASVAAVNDLRTICTNPNQIISPCENPIVNLIKDLLEDLADRKVVLFCWYKSTAQYLAQVCTDMGLIHHLSTGDDSISNRQMNIETFRKTLSPSILIATIASTGTGIDLTEASAAIFVEFHYLPAMNQQAEDRLHRFTTTTSPTIYYLVASNSIESLIWYNCNRKLKDATDILSESDIVKHLAKGNCYED